MEWMDYLLMEHYGWTLMEVHELSLENARQALCWAMAMNREEPESHSGEVVHLSYDRIPPVGDEPW